jgi:hypothetical protein
VIASFYDELAGKTIRLAREINTTAVKLSTVTVAEWRTLTALERLAVARQRSRDANFHACIPVLEARVGRELESMGDQFSHCVAVLSRDLQEIQVHMRAIDVVAVTSRIEAHNAKEFRSGLLHMTDTIQAQTAEIKARVAVALSLLTEALL